MISISDLNCPSVSWWDTVIKGMRHAYKSYDKSDSGYCFGWQARAYGSYDDCEHCRFARAEDLEEFDLAECEYPGGDDFIATFIIGPNDMKLAKQLIGSDSPSHRKFLRQLPVMMNITAPLYFWKQLDTYKVGTTANSQSTMHCLTKNEFKPEDFSFDTNGHGALPIEIHGYELLNLKVLNNLRKEFLETGNKSYWNYINELLPQSYNQTRLWTANYEVLLTIIAQRLHHKLKMWRDLIVFWLKNVTYLLEFACFDGIVKIKDGLVVINDSSEEVLFSVEDVYRR